MVAGGSITEILFLLEKQKQIVALDVTSNYPNETKIIHQLVMLETYQLKESCR